MTTALFYHSADADGWCSGAIAYRALIATEHVIPYPINYGEQLPDFERPVDKVVITDFSFELETMEKLFRQYGDNLIWIDHHKSAIQEISKLGQLNGIQDEQFAAAELTWKYFNQDQPPIAVKYISDYDIWKFQYGETTMQFQSGLLIERKELVDCAAQIWEVLLSQTECCDQLVARTIENGKAITKLKTELAHLTLKGAKTIEWCGHTTIIANISPVGWLTSFVAQVARDNSDLYPGEVLIGWSTYQDAKQEQAKTIFSLRALSNDVDVSLLAKNYGGGGHKGAAGFSILESSVPDILRD